MEGLIWLVLLSVAGYWVVRLMRDYWRQGSVTTGEAGPPASLLDVLKQLPGYVRGRRGETAPVLSQPLTPPGAGSSPVAAPVLAETPPLAAPPSPSVDSPPIESPPPQAADSVPSPSSSALSDSRQVSFIFDSSGSVASLQSAPEAESPATNHDVDRPATEAVEKLSPQVSHLEISFDLKPGARVQVTIEALDD